jgi:hypothetical protein
LYARRNFGRFGPRRLGLWPLKVDLEHNKGSGTGRETDGPDEKNETGS